MYHGGGGTTTIGTELSGRNPVTQARPQLLRESVSCSNRIAARGVLGSQGALGSLLLTPLYVNSIAIGEVAQDIRGVVRDDCRRAF